MDSPFNKCWWKNWRAKKKKKNETEPQSYTAHKNKHKLDKRLELET